MPLTLLRTDGSLTAPTVGLVDSGADCSNFPADWAEQLGIDIDKDCVKETGTTAGGECTHYLYEPGVEAIIMGRKLKLHAMFQPGLEVILLGREDFFREFKVSFDQRAATFDVEPYEDAA
jgi:hypothetical protein